MTKGMGPGDRGDSTYPELRDVATAAEFGAALSELRTRAGMSIRQVSRKADIPSGTLGGYFSGRHLPTVGQSEATVRLLGVLGVDREHVPAWTATLDRVRRGARAQRGRIPSPYRGLESYGVADAEWFVGREDLTARLLASVSSLREPHQALRAVTVLGASGSGKSSLLQAGLLAALERAGVRTGVMAPGADPMDGLQRALTVLGGADGPSVLVVDQLEEVLGDGVAGGVRTRFLERLAELASTPDGVVLVLGLRADFFGAALGESALLPLVSTHQLVVAPMGEDSLRRVISEPSARAGRAVDDDLVALLLRDISARGGPDASALPLLSHALLETWNHTATGRLGTSDYTATGGVSGAVQRTAEGVYAGLDALGAAAARHLFWQLVSVDEDGFVTRRRVRHDDLVESETLLGVIEAFLAQRILTATETTLEISHEVLLEAWPRLHDWVAEDRDDLVTRRRITLAAQDWETHDREPSALLAGPVLVVAQDLADRKPEALGAAEHTLLEASVQRRDAAVAAGRRRQRRLRAMLVAVVVLALVTSGLSAYLVKAVGDAEDQRRDAARARDQALSREVSFQATRWRDSDPALAMQLAAAAYGLAPTVEARSAVLEAAETGFTTRLTVAVGGIRAVTSPDGSLVAVATAVGTVALYATREGTTPALVSTTSVGDDPLYGAAFGPDGDLLAVGGAAGEVTVLDVTDPADPQPREAPLEGAASTIRSVAFSNDGSRVWAAADQGLRGWRLTGSGSDAPLAPRVPVPGRTTSVALSPRGLIATGSTDGRLRFWRVADGELVLQRALQVGTRSNAINALDFSPDGALLAAGTEDRTVRVWDVSERPRPVTEPLTGFPSYVNDVRFDGTGSRLGAVGSSGSAQVFDTADWSRTDSFPTTTNYTSVAFLPDAEQLVTGAIDGTVQLWDLGGGARITGLGDTVFSLSYTADGDTLYAGVAAGAAEVVQLDTTDPTAPRRTGRVFRGPDDASAVNGVAAVSPDGSMLVAGTVDGDIVVWRLDDGAAVDDPVVIAAADDTIENIQFSPDGRFLATASDDNTVSVFDAASAAALRLLRRLPTGGITIGLDFGPDSSLLAAGSSDGRIQLWSLEDDPREVASIPAFDTEIYAVAFGPDRRTLLAGGADRAVRRWDVTEPADPHPIGEPLRGPTDTIWAIAPGGPDDGFGAASADGSVWLWSDGDSPTLRAKLTSLGVPALQLARHPTDEGYAAAGSDGIATYWSTDVDQVLDDLCAVAGSPITKTEWRTYVPGAAYDPPCPEPTEVDADAELS